MKLTPRFALAFILYASVLLASVGLLAFRSGRAFLRQSTVVELEGTALRKQENLDRWVEARQADIVALTGDPAIINGVTRLVEASPNTPEFQSAHDALVETLLPRLSANEFRSVSLLDPQTGQVIASTDPLEEGSIKAEEDYFIKGQSGPFVRNASYSKTLQRPVMTASAPLSPEDGRLLAVLAADLDMESLNDLIVRRTNIHETDEAYLVSPSNLLITRPRLVDNPTLYETGVDTEHVNRCLSQESGVTESADYRGIDSFIVYRWMPAHQLCLVVKIDQAEAYAPIQSFGRVIAGISVLALLVGVALAVILARSMTRPILALQEGVARFRQGELKTRLDDTPRDEMGQLAGEFNKMADALVEEQSHLRRRAEQFFNLSPDLLCTIDTSGHILDPNPAWDQVLGYTREDLSVKLLIELVHPDDLDQTQSVLRRLARTGTGRFESRFLHRDGQYRWLAWVVVNSPQDTLLYAAARDVTERHLTEEKLRDKTEELERSNRDLEEFAHVASHDLQEPLRLVSTHIQFLARRYKGKLDADADEFIGFALEGTDRMKSLLSDLLAYTNISTGSVNFEPVEMEEVFTQVLQNMQPVIRENGALVTHDPLPIILGDSAQMMLLVQNILENAIKFRGKNVPRIHMGVSQITERWLLFVRDNGIGIDPRFTERVFVIFQRLHSRDDYPGTGVGLAISRKIVERHGGRIWVDSEPGKGSTFYFTLQPAESLQPELKRPEPVTQRPKTTVVDRAKDLI